jgi:hypothetical protein
MAPIHTKLTKANASILTRNKTSMTIAKSPSLILVEQQPSVCTSGTAVEEDVYQSQAQVKQKKKRDPNAPSPPITAYRYFLKHRPPGITTMKPGEHWKSLGTEEKSIYERMAERDRIRYDIEMKRYRVSQALNQLLDSMQT